MPSEAAQTKAKKPRQLKAKHVARREVEGTPEKLVGTLVQPVSNVQWVERDRLHANQYNPNRVFPPELELLKISILEDGWTQPIVARPEPGATREAGALEVVDGFHRWMVSADPEIAEMTDGYVPVVFAREDLTPAQQRMSTIRHNRARGSHNVLRMAEIVRHLIDEEGCSYEQVMTRLQMEWEEVDRLYDRGSMLARGSTADGSFNKGWVPG